MRFTRDKQLHLVAGFLLGWTGLIVTGNAILGGLIAGLFWGCFRESINKWGLFFQKRTGWDWYDIIYTVAGSVGMGLILQLTGWHTSVKNSESISEMPILFGVVYLAAITLFIYLYKKK